MPDSKQFRINAELLVCPELTDSFISAYGDDSICIDGYMSLEDLKRLVKLIEDA